MPNPVLNFEQVEALRKHMMINTTQMSKLIGVSRVTYSGWLKGKPVRKSNDAKARAALKRMFSVLEQHQWPMPEVIGMTPLHRFNTLLELLPPQE